MSFKIISSFISRVLRKVSKLSFFIENICNLKNFKIVFRLKIKVPDLQPVRKSKVPGLIYKINKDIENKLDKYEDYPKLYTKKYFRYNKKKIMYYIIKKKSPITKPSGYYFKIMKEGYRQNNFKLQIDL